MRIVESLKGAALALVLVAWTAVPAASQGWIEPDIARGDFAVEKTRSEVRVRVDGRVARLEVSEWFVNRGGRVAEGEYLYPLPGESVFQGFSLFQGETELRGEIMDAERARGIYEEIVRRRKDPALIELAGEGLLRARVFPIQPGEERKVTIRYTQVLVRAGNALRLQYVGAVREFAEGRGPQTGRPTSPSDRMSFRVDVVDASRFLDPFSPTHELDVRRTGDEMRISVEGEVRGRLAVFFPFSGEPVGVSVATHRPGGEQGYFMLTLSPDRNAEAGQPRDVTAVLDVSGSMSGEKIEQARQALHQLLASLSADDRFRLIAFSSAVRAQSPEWRLARGEALEQAGDWIDRLVADGGTNIEDALTEAFRLESPPGRLPVVLFLTDGLPSVGIESPERLADMAQERAGRARVFAFGVGNDVNTHLLDRLSQAGRGDTDYVQPGENVERVIALLSAKIRHPVLTNLEIEGGEARLSEIYPVQIPDVFAGEDLILFGRFGGSGERALTVRGDRGGRRVEFATGVDLPEESEDNAYIPRLWASRKLGHLERQIWTEGETPGLVEEIRSTAIRYGLPTRYTSYLVEEPELVARGPSGSGGARPHRMGSAALPSVPTSGAAAVQAAEAARGRRSARSTADLEQADSEVMRDLIGGSDARSTKVAGGRLFRLRGGVWTDAGHVEGSRVVRVRAFSAAYFDVLEALPELAPVLRELEHVLLAGGELTLGVGEDGMEEISERELRELVAGFRGGDGRT